MFLRNSSGPENIFLAISFSQIEVEPHIGQAGLSKLDVSL